MYFVKSSSKNTHKVKETTIKEVCSDVVEAGLSHSTVSNWLNIKVATTNWVMSKGDMKKVRGNRVFIKDVFIKLRKQNRQERPGVSASYL